MISIYPSLQPSSKHLQGIFAEFFIKKIRERHASASWVAVSLTLKQHLRRSDNSWQFLTRTEVQKCIKLLLKRLNLQSYGAAYRRKKKRLAVIPAIETSTHGRLHIHLTLPSPRLSQRPTRAFL
jgi:hypothetical protein